MAVFDSSPLTPLVVRADRPLLDERQLAAVAFLARYAAVPWSRIDRICDSSSSGAMRRGGAAGGDAYPHRAVPGLDGRSWSGGVDG